MAAAASAVVVTVVAAVTGKSQRVREKSPSASADGLFCM
jgi:hypothetical protein